MSKFKKYLSFVLFFTALPYINGMDALQFQIQFGSDSRIGNRRVSNEDTFLASAFTWDGTNHQATPTTSRKSIFPVIEIYAVFDGHGGSDVSEYLRKNFILHFLNNLPSDLDPQSIDQALRQSFADANNIILSTKEWVDQGSTALVILKIANSLYIAHVGDSRAGIIKNNELIAITKDHGLRTKEEREKAVEWLSSQSLNPSSLYFYGCWRINGLSLYRALGDSNYGNHINRSPDITHYEITPEDKFLILACDGVWEFLDTMKNEPIDIFIDIQRLIITAIQNKVNMDESTFKDAKKLSCFITDLAEKSGVTDNFTTIAVKLN